MLCSVQRQVNLVWPSHPPRALTPCTHPAHPHTAGLLCSAAFGGSAILAGLEIRCVCLQNFIHPYNAGLLCSAAFGGSAILAGLEIRRVKRSRLGPVKGEVASFHDDRAASPGLQGLGVTAEEEETDDTTQGECLHSLLTKLYLSPGCFRGESS